MKRKKWSELEEQTLLNKYADLLNSGTLQKLKTREKKFKPIADQVNSLHHLQDPVTFPFKWTWRDVSIKVQNMRHQYLGVKQKIRVSDDEFNWKDGENHWENFLRYKEVFGDVEIEGKSGGDFFKGCLGFGECESEDLFDGEEGEEEEEGNGEVGKGKREVGFGGIRRLGLVSAQVGELRELVVRREEKRREREFDREECGVEREGKRREMEMRREMRFSEREERMEIWDMELEERELGWARREFERRVSLEKELEEERRKRRMAEEQREEEEMEWRERMVAMQIEHEKTMMQFHANACQNQMQILGLMARLVCQFFGSPSDGLGAGLGGLPPQVLQNLHHSGGLDDNGKPDANSPSEFL